MECTFLGEVGNQRIKSVNKQDRNSDKCCDSNIIECKLQENRDVDPFCSLKYPTCLIQRLAHIGLK